MFRSERDKAQRENEKFANKHDDASEMSRLFDSTFYDGFDDAVLGDWTETKCENHLIVDTHVKSKTGKISFTCAGMCILNFFFITVLAGAAAGAAAKIIAIINSSRFL